MDKIALGAKIREIRDKKGLSREDVAGSAGISQGALEKVEKGHNTSIDTLAAVSGTLDIRLAPLIEAAETGTTPLPDFKSCGELLLALSQADTDFQRFVLTVIHKDVSHMRGSPKLEPLIPQVLALLKLL